MSDIAKRPTRTPRRVREKRANQLVLVGGVAGAVAVVGFLLALFTDVIGFGVPLLAAIVAVVCVFLFRRAIAP
ncbi:MAG: hypothetical protein QOJ63_3309 [Solirubrobacteraceae bacterium]|jgi:hypothetical protein|nr:hypothetical protein [Solirubrobacteraceae bacterium]